ncbi:MAG: hypothetical protein ACI35P_10985 [Bacillus sp. (in: firmicutes)]
MEELLYKHSKIKEAAVVGTSEACWGKGLLHMSSCMRGRGK